VSCDGVAAGGSLAFLTNGAQSLVVGTAPAPVTVGSGPDTLDLKVNEDAWNGDAQFTVSVDGRQIGGTLTAQAAYRTFWYSAASARGRTRPRSHSSTTPGAGRRRRTAISTSPARRWTVRRSAAVR
jgi:hypothetical protein